MAYSKDLRERVLAATAGPLTNRQAAKLFQLSISTVERWRQQQRATGQVQAGRSTGRRRRIPVEQETRLIAQLQADPDATLAAHCQQWQAVTGVGLSPATLCRTLQRLAWTVKKSA